MTSLTAIRDTIEANVLGGLMMDNRAMERVEFLTPDMFTGGHQDIFEAMVSLHSRSEPFDSFLLAEMSLPGTCGEFSYLASLQGHTASTANICAYARKVEETAVRRRVVASCGELIDKADSMSASELIDAAQASMMELSGSDTHEAYNMRALMSRCVNALDERFNNPGTLTGLSTSFVDLDARLCGLQDSDLIIIAGRPSMGKTTLAINIAENVSREAPVAVFSMEMPAEDLGDQSICALGRIDRQKYRSGKLDDDDWPRITSAVSRLTSQDLLIDDTGALSIMRLRSKARRLHRKHNLGLIVVDYLQLMSSTGAESRRLGIEEITRGLKALAKELRVPVIVLSQLTRECEKRPNKRPIMSDLRESGSIEQDADVILFVYRDEVYNPDSTDKGTAEIICAKQRKGPIGIDRLVFLGHYGRFETFAGNKDQWSGPDAA